MGYDINALKRISQSTAQVINSQDENSRRNYTDDRFWKLERSAKTGNGSAIIRFLPALKEGTLPWVQVFDYFIKAPSGRYYIERSLRTLKKPDPMREFIAAKWNKPGITEFDKQELRMNWRERMQYYANILIVNDPAHPENNGKVKLFAFGKKLMDKILAKQQDEFGDSVNVFDWTVGCNFKLRAKTADGFVNYDNSEFDVSSSVGTDEQIIAIADQMYDLQEFVDPANPKFKSYETLKAKVEELFGDGAAQHSAARHEPSEPDPAAFESKTPVRAAKPAPVAPDNPAEPEAPWEVPAENTQDDDDVDVDALLKDL